MPPTILTVPMNPEFLPEAALLVVGLLCAALSVQCLITRDMKRLLLVAPISLGCIALAVSLSSSEWLHMAVSSRGPVFLKPAAPSEKDSMREAIPFTTLTLGGVILEVQPANHYELSLNGDSFMTLDSLATGLVVSCNAATGTRGVYAHVNRNYLVPTGTGAQLRVPDPHTIEIEHGGETIARIHYSGPRGIEISGRFHPFQQWVGTVAGAKAQSQEPGIISFTEGIAWNRGGIPPGNTIDLRPQGKGKIDFARSGIIQIRK